MQSLAFGSVCFKVGFDFCCCFPSKPKRVPLKTHPFAEVIIRLIFHRLSIFFWEFITIGQFSRFVQGMKIQTEDCAPFFDVCFGTKNTAAFLQLAWIPKRPLFFWLSTAFFWVKGNKTGSFEVQLSLKVVGPCSKGNRLASRAPPYTQYPLFLVGMICRPSTKKGSVLRCKPRFSKSTREI